MAAESGVVARFAVERIFAEAADQQVIAETNFERVVAHVAEERVLAIATEQQVVAGLAEQGGLAPRSGELGYPKIKRGRRTSAFRLIPNKSRHSRLLFALDAPFETEARTDMNLTRFTAITLALFATALSQGVLARDYPYQTAEPQKTGWLLIAEERTYVLKPEHKRRPGSEAKKHLPAMWPVCPSAGHWGGTNWLDTHAKLVDYVQANQAFGVIDLAFIVKHILTISRFGDFRFPSGYCFGGLASFTIAPCSSLITRMLNLVTASRSLVFRLE